MFPFSAPPAAQSLRKNDSLYQLILRTTRRPALHAGCLGPGPCPGAPSKPLSLHLGYLYHRSTLQPVYRRASLLGFIRCAGLGTSTGALYVLACAQAPPVLSGFGPRQALPDPFQFLGHAFHQPMTPPRPYPVPERCTGGLCMGPFLSARPLRFFALSAFLLPKYILV